MPINTGIISACRFRFNQSYSGEIPYVYELAIYGEKRLGKYVCTNLLVWFCFLTLTAVN